VAAISKSLLKKVLSNAQERGEDRLAEATKRMQDKATQKGGYKTRYLALCILIEYLDPFKFTTDNPKLIKEVMQSTTETLASGKYVLNFFEALLKKALTKSNQEAEKSKVLA
jgi:hypothetical protein